MLKFKVISLASVAPMALLAQSAWAEEIGPDGVAVAGSDVIVVPGRGETRHVQEIQASDISALLSGTSVIRAIEKLPSVNIQSADPFGNYEWSTRVTIRSFNQNQLGFTFDGITGRHELWQP